MASLGTIEDSTKQLTRILFIAGSKAVVCDCRVHGWGYTRGHRAQASEPAEEHETRVLESALDDLILPEWNLCTYHQEGAACLLLSNYNPCHVGGENSPGPY
jgi:hypothetical protein